MTAVGTPELAETAADLTGYGPAAAKVIEGLLEMATAPKTAKQSSDLLILLGGSPDGLDLLGLVAAVAQHLGDPATNPGLRELTPRRAQQIRSLTRQYAAYDADFAPRDLLAEAAGAADLDCPHPTD
jgi:hypothetical protein